MNSLSECQDYCSQDLHCKAIGYFLSSKACPLYGQLEQLTYPQGFIDGELGSNNSPTKGTGQTGWRCYIKANDTGITKIS